MDMKGEFDNDILDFSLRSLKCLFKPFFFSSSYYPFWVCNWNPLAIQNPNGVLNTGLESSKGTYHDATTS